MCRICAFFYVVMLTSTLDSCLNYDQNSSQGGPRNRKRRSKICLANSIVQWQNHEVLVVCSIRAHQNGYNFGTSEAADLVPNGFFFFKFDSASENLYYLFSEKRFRKTQFFNIFVPKEIRTYLAVNDNYAKILITQYKVRSWDLADV